MEKVICWLGDNEVATGCGDTKKAALEDAVGWWIKDKLTETYSLSLADVDPLCEKILAAIADSKFVDEGGYATFEPGVHYDLCCEIYDVAEKLGIKNFGK